MPRRPPKKWFRDCEGKVARKSPRATDPAAICGALWNKKMSTAAKRSALSKESTRGSREEACCHDCARGGSYSRKPTYRVRRVAQGHYQLHELEGGRQTGGADLYGTAREVAAQVREIVPRGAAVSWPRTRGKERGKR